MHLRAAFVEARPRDPWDVQMKFDNYCATACHEGYGLTDMRHQGVTAGRPYLLIGFGLTDALARAVPEGVPLDSDLTSAAPPGAPVFGTCVTCHDPHGTGNPDQTGGSNHMVRYRYQSAGELCAICHI